MQLSFIMLLRIAMIVITVVSGGPAAKKAPKKKTRDLELPLVCLALYLCRTTLRYSFLLECVSDLAPTGTPIDSFYVHTPLC
jgi:hypothetical protein